MTILTRKEKSAINKAKWAERPDDIHVLNEKKALARQPIGTAVGNKQRMSEFKELLLSQLNGGRVIRKVLDIALDDNHPGQMTALKMCLDRQLPVSLFEATKNQPRSQIQINITGIGETKIGEVIDVESEL